MQNKGLVKIFALLLTLVCLFYLSFSLVTRHYNKKALEIAQGDEKVAQDYLDSLSSEKVYFGNWTLKDCREMEISLGLDLKGGMNVILCRTLSRFWLITRLMRNSIRHYQQLLSKLQPVRKTLSHYLLRNIIVWLRRVVWQNSLLPSS